MGCPMTALFFGAHGLAAGVLLDLFVGIFVISIITNHINRAFASMDTRRLVSLKE